MRRLAGTPLEMAARLRRRVLDEVGLPLTVGIARTKFLAKVASGVAKPDGLLLVPPDRELAFLHPLPVEALWGVGPATAARAPPARDHEVRDVARMTEGSLVAILGQASGRHLHALAHNRDAAAACARGARRRSIGSQRAIGRGPWTAEAIDTTLVGLVDRVMRRLRTARRVGRTVVLRLRFDDFSRATRSYTLPESTNETRTVLAAARGAARGGDADDRARTASRWSASRSRTWTTTSQLVLPLDRPYAALDAALDEVRERFGADAITRGVLLGRSQGLTVPLLPD